MLISEHQGKNAIVTSYEEYTFPMSGASYYLDKYTFIRPENQVLKWVTLNEPSLESTFLQYGSKALSPSFTPMKGRDLGMPKNILMWLATNASSLQVCITSGQLCFHSIFIKHEKYNLWYLEYIILAGGCLATLLYFLLIVANNEEPRFLKGAKPYLRL